MNRVSEEHKEEVSRPYWGTVGKWLKGAHLRGLIEQLGSDLEGCLGPVPSAERDDTALLAANMNFARRPGGADEPVDDDAYDSEDDDNAYDSEKN